jgi:ABC-type phosphate/phosphonate transport system permease subunit
VAHFEGRKPNVAAAHHKNTPMENQATTEAWVGLAILIGLSVVIAFMFHWWSKAYVNASLCAAIVSSFLFQLFDYLKEGYFNKFALVGFIFGAFYSCVIAFMVGLPFFILRRRASSPSLSTTPSQSEEK